MKLKDQSLFNDISNKLNKIIFKKLTNNKSIFFAGNGGSASISNHAVCDFLKNYKIKTKLKKIYSLSSNIELITAISNDYSYEIFEFQIDKLSSKGDLLILISSSGNSENIIKAARLAIKEVEILASRILGARLKKLETIIMLILKIMVYARTYICLYFIMWLTYNMINHWAF